MLETRCLEFCRELSLDMYNFYDGGGGGGDTVHCTLFNLNCTMYTVHCTLYTKLCTVYVQCSVETFKILTSCLLNDTRGGAGGGGAGGGRGGKDQVWQEGGVSAA